MLKTIASITAALASLTLFASVTIGGLLVTRSSLLGYEVIGPSVHVLDLEDAAAVLARAAALATSAPASPPAAVPLDLLEGPRATWEGSGIMQETWRRGPAAESRLRRLRRALANVGYRSGQRSRRLTSELGGDRETILTITLTYSTPPGSRVPALG